MNYPLKIFFLIIYCALYVCAASFTQNNFDVNSSSSGLIVDDSLQLDIAEWGMVRLYNRAPNGGVPHSRSGSIVAVSNNTFMVVWADSVTATSNAKEKIYERQVLLSETGFSQQAAVTLYSLAAPKTQYLHAALGSDGVFAAFVDNNGNGNLIGCIGAQSLQINALSESKPHCSMTHFDADTFLVAMCINLSRLVIKKVVANTNGISVTNIVDTVARGGVVGADVITNPVVTCDSLKHIVVLYTYGSNLFTKRVRAKVYDGAFNKLDSLDIDDNAAFSNKTIYYRDADVVSYAPGSFLVASWRSADNLYATQLTIQQNDQVLKNGPSVLIGAGQPQMPALAVNSSELVVAWRGDLNGDSYAGIEAAVYPITNGVLSLTAADTFLLSAAGVTVPLDSLNGTELNVAVDSIGNIGATWNNADSVEASILGRRAIRVTSGLWASPVESVAVASDDSIKYSSGTLSLVDALYGSATLSIQISGDQNTWSTLSDMSNAAALALNARGVGKKYFRYTIGVARNNSNLLDSLRSPIVKQCAIAYDVKPLVVSLDSLYVNNVKNTTVTWGDTITVFSRSDSLSVFARLKDSDTNDLMHATITLRDSVKTVNQQDTVDYFVSASFPPVTVSDTVVSCVFGASDAAAWVATSQQVYVKTRNYIPQLSVRAIVDNPVQGYPDTFPVNGRVFYQVQQTDSIVFLYTVTDSNDQAIKAYYRRNNALVDSVVAHDTSRVVFYGNSMSHAAGDSVQFLAADADTSFVLTAHCGVNHFPKLDSVRIAGKRVHNNDSLTVSIGLPLSVRVYVNDSDKVFGDTITFRYGTHADSVIRRDSIYTFTPSLADSFLQVYIYDLFNKSDSLLLNLRYSWLALDSTSNPALYTAKKILRDSIAMIIGGGFRDTIFVPIVNTGNDTMSITSLRFAGHSSHWMALGVSQPSGWQTFDSLLSNEITPVVLYPAVSESIAVYFSPDGLKGDTTIIDTLFLTSSDRAHPQDTIIVRMRYDDLPQIVTFKPNFSVSQPYWQLKQKSRTVHNYTIPPCSRIGIEFSERMDTLSVNNAVAAYSLRDSIINNRATPITMVSAWDSTQTVVYFSPHYTAPSSAYRLLTPPDHCFIPTDSIALVITSSIMDCAHNALDVDRNYLRDVNSDTTLSFLIDSTKFELVSTVPADRDTGVGLKPVLLLTFSDPLYGGTIDTARIANKSLVVTSDLLAGDTVHFDSVRVRGATVRFYLSIRFYYGDTVFCHYRAVTARDSMGYSIDMNGDGIPENIMDSSSTSDDVIWHFIIAHNRINSVTPANGTSTGKSNQPITLHFSQRILPGTFDTDTSIQNRSFNLVTRYSGGHRIGLRSVTVAPDSMSIIIVARGHFYTRDSVGCNFLGFARTFNYDSMHNLPSASSGMLNAYAWSFGTGDAGFYTYPNPYRPGSDPRHCSNPAIDPCGIWFKNFHSLKPGLTSVRVKVFTMNTHPVFETATPINFEENNPDVPPLWKWDTRNNKGELISSGVYLYAIYDGSDNKVLMRGKIVIVR